jgi:RNA polymerase sigma-70 factor (ECF subfamily)
MASITETLWRQAKAGDEAAYGRLFALHADRALLFIRARLGPHLRGTIESGDVLQDAYLAAHRGFETFTYSDDGSFLRWLCRIIENRIRDWNDYARAEKRQAAPLPDSDPTGPITALDRKLDRERLLAALDRLSEDHRVVLLLRYFEGLSSEEVGARLERSAGAVRKLTARALAELGKVMKADASTGQSTSP